MTVLLIGFQPIWSILADWIIWYSGRTAHTERVRSSLLDRLTGLEVFARVAAAGSLSAAGRTMGMSQTMVTKHLAALEARLGARLFHRTTRRLSITEAGRSYLEASERILADIEAANDAVAADRVEPRGLLR